MRRRKVLVKVLACLFLLPLSASFVLAQPTAKVEKTGQTTSYATGDDGDYEKGVAWPNPRFTDNGDQTVTDNLTGLMWTKDANLFGTQANWLGAIWLCETLELGANGCNTYTDWRLPNSNELASLVDKEYYNPAVPNTAGTGQWSEGDPFTGVQSYGYWSSTTLAANTSYAWIVYVNNGFVFDNDKSSSYYVWPVRGGND